MLKPYLPSLPDSRETWALLLLPVVIAITLLAFDRFGVEHRFWDMFGQTLQQQGTDNQQFRLLAQAWLTLSTIGLWVIVPVLYFRLLVPDWRDWGLGASLAHWPVYLLLTAIMLPVVAVAATQPAFNTFYPLYKPPTITLWMTFEVWYLLQFFCVEFFFRGPILLFLGRKFDGWAVGIMVVPYALIHIYKPFPEAVGSIIAGYVLGWLALRTRSIWPGVFVHCSVALAMDTLALWQTGRLAQLLAG